MSGLLDDDMTELVGADVPRVDMVDKAANGRQFVLMKNAGDSPNLLTVADVEELITKGDAEGATTVTDTTTTDDVEKADNLDVTEPLVGAGDNPLSNAPGSVEWETIDADSAQKWVSILGRAKYAIGILADRELMEDSAGDSDGWSNAWNLRDAQDAIDWAIGILATYAASEQAEVDLGDVEKARLTAIANVAKALTDAQASVAVVEGIAPIAKAGRVLSAQNETSLRNALDEIQKVLASLPTAPVVEDEEVEKAAPAAETEEEPVVDAAKNEDTGKPDMSPEARAARVLAAKGEPVVPATPEVEVVKDDAAPADGTTPELEAVFDASGNLKGVVDPAAIQPVSGATAGVDDTPAAPAADTTAVAAPAVPAVAPAVKAETEQETEAADEAVVTKADLDALIKAQVDAVKAEFAQEVEKLRSPATPNVARYGKFPEMSENRGQAGDGVDVQKQAERADELRKVAARADNPEVAQLANDELATMSRKWLANARAGRPVPTQPPRR